MNGVSRTIIVISIIAIIVIALVASILLMPAPQPAPTPTPTPTVSTPTPTPGTPTPTPTPTPTLVEIELFRIGHNYEPDTLDLHATTWADITSVIVYGTYLIRDWRTGEFLGRLAEKIWLEDEGRIVYIKLRPGLKFADGTPLNASAIKFTYERMISKNAPTLGTFGKLESVEVVDELTAKLIFKEPFAPLFVTLTNSYQGVFPPDYVTRVGDVEFGRKPLSAGPFYVVEWRMGDYILYERNPYYIRRTDLPDGGQVIPVPIRRLQIKIIRDPAALVSALLAGDVDLITTVPPDLYPELLARNGTDIIVVAFPGMQMNYFGFNVQRWPFNDLRVRRAISIILGGEDVRQGLKDILNGLALPVWGPLVPTIVGYNEQLELYARELNHYKLPLGERIRIARQLLKEAGWDDRDGDGILEYINGTKFKFPLLVPSEFYDKKEAEFIAYILRQAGLDFEINILDTVTIRDRYLVRGEHHVFLFIYGWQDAMILRYLFHTQGVRRTWYMKPELDELLDKMTTTVDPTGRQKYIDAVCKDLIDNAPWVPLYAPLSVVAWRAEYTGIIINEYEGGTILFDLITKKLGY